MSTENLIQPAIYQPDNGEGDETERLAADPPVSSETVSDKEGAHGDQDEMFGDEEPKSNYLAKMRGMSCCQIFLLVVSCLLFIFSLCMLFGCYLPLIRGIILPQMVISNGTEAYEIWRLTPVPLLLKLYLFNLTNPYEVANKGYKPILQECGPYVWRELHEKQNITFHPNATVTYYQQRWWIWDQELSGDNSRDDPITTVNIIPVTVAWTLRNSGTLTHIGVDMVFSSLMEEAVINTTVNNLLFEGVEDPLLDWVQNDVIPENGKWHYLLPFMGGIAGLAQFDKFAWFYKRNMSLEYDGLYNMKTGADNFSNLGVIDWWNKERATKFYKPPCNSVKGSAGEIFPPNLQKDKVEFYSSDLCMSATLYYKEEANDTGVTGYRYWGSNHTFANSSVVPGNECYCVNKTCAPTGLLNAESCRMGAPAYISFPHFFNADPFLLDGVAGLQPNESKHAFVMDIIPELGIPMRVSPRIQINLKIRPENSYIILKNLPDAYLPMLWFEILAEMTPELAHRAQMATYLLRSPVMNLVVWLVLIAVSALTIIGVVTVHCMKAGGGEERRWF